MPLPFIPAAAAGAATGLRAALPWLLRLLSGAKTGAKATGRFAAQKTPIVGSAAKARKHSQQIGAALSKQGATKRPFRRAARGQDPIRRTTGPREVTIPTFRGGKGAMKGLGRGAGRGAATKTMPVEEAVQLMARRARQGRGGLTGGQTVLGGFAGLTAADMMGLMGGGAPAEELGGMTEEEFIQMLMEDPQLNQIASMPPPGMGGPPPGMGGPPPGMGMGGPPQGMMGRPPGMPM